MEIFTHAHRTHSIIEMKENGEDGSSSIIIMILCTVTRHSANGSDVYKCIFKEIDSFRAPKHFNIYANVWSRRRKCSRRTSFGSSSVCVCAFVSTLLYIYCFVTHTGAGEREREQRGITHRLIGVHNRLSLFFRECVRPFISIFIWF